MIVAMVVFELDRDEVEATVADLGLGHELVGERADLLGSAAQNQRLHAVVVIQMHMHGRQHDLVMLVLEIGEALGEIARMVIVDIA